MPVVEPLRKDFVPGTVGDARAFVKDLPALRLRHVSVKLGQLLGSQVGLSRAYRSVELPMNCTPSFVHWRGKSLIESTSGTPMHLCVLRSVGLQTEGWKLARTVSLVPFTGKK